MNTQLNNLLNEISLNKNTEVKVSATPNCKSSQQKKSFTVAELWNIQRRRKTRNLFCLQLA